MGIGKSQGSDYENSLQQASRSRPGSLEAGLKILQVFNVGRFDE